MSLDLSGHLDKAHPSHRTQFQPTRLTVEELTDHIQNGLAYSPLQWVGGKRHGELFLSATGVALDFDKLTPAQAKSVLENEFTKTNALLAHTTASDAPDERCMRVIFAFSEPVTSETQYRALYADISAKYNGLSDSSCGDLGRFLFGAQACQVWEYGNWVAVVAEWVSAPDLSQIKPTIAKLVKQLKEAKEGERHSTALRVIWRARCIWNADWAKGEMNWLGVVAQFYKAWLACHRDDPCIIEFEAIVRATEKGCTEKASPLAGYFVDVPNVQCNCGVCHAIIVSEFEDSVRLDRWRGTLGKCAYARHLRAVRISQQIMIETAERPLYASVVSEKEFTQWRGRDKRKRIHRYMAIPLANDFYASQEYVTNKQYIASLTACEEKTRYICLITHTRKNQAKTRYICLIRDKTKKMTNW